MITLTEISPIKLPGLTTIKAEFTYSQEIIDTIKQVPNAVYHKNLKCWEFPVTSLSRAIELLHNFSDITLNVLPDWFTKL